MHWLNRAGNPLLSGFLNMLFRTPIGDAHCGLRAMRRDALAAARPPERRHGARLGDGHPRSREHLVDPRAADRAAPARAASRSCRRFRDGWRHLRLILVYNPTFLFIVPGLVLLAVGSILMLLVLADVTISGRGLFLHTLIAASLLVVVGTQLVGFGLCARTYAVYQLGDRDPLLERLSGGSGSSTGSRSVDWSSAPGWSPVGVVVGRWIAEGFGPLGGGAAGGRRGHARDRRDADLLHVVPALDHGPEAPGRLIRLRGLRRAALEEQQPAGEAREREGDPPDEREQRRIGRVDPDAAEQDDEARLAHAVARDRDRQRGDDQHRRHHDREHGVGDVDVDRPGHEPEREDDERLEAEPERGRPGQDRGLRAGAGCRPGPRPARPAPVGGSRRPRPVPPRTSSAATTRTTTRAPVAAPSAPTRVPGTAPGSTASAIQATRMRHASAVCDRPRRS